MVEQDQRIAYEPLIRELRQEPMEGGLVLPAWKGQRTRAAHALEAASKRIAELERELQDEKDISAHAHAFHAAMEKAEARLAALQAERAEAVPVAFQVRVQPWMLACFGEEISRDTVERNHRFLEEALELVQALGCTQSEAHQLVDYTFGRPAGEPGQEVGGVKVTLAALCLANDLDMDECGETELARIWTKVEKIRAKQAAKPKHSPLPEEPAPPPAPDVERMREALKPPMWGRWFSEADAPAGSYACLWSECRDGVWGKPDFAWMPSQGRTPPKATVRIMPFIMPSDPQSLAALTPTPTEGSAK